MITKEQLQTMSDFEVNKALCALIGKDVSGVDEQRNMMTGAVTEYCDKYSAIMPLAFEHGISLMYCNEHDGWMGIKNNMTGVSHHFTHVNPLRAIACCLILVLQEKKK